MWTANLTREKLVYFLSGSGGASEPIIPPSRGSISEPISGEVLLVWSDNPETTPCSPSVLVIKDGDSRDFLAWAWTYLVGFRPVTAYFRVLEFSTFRKVQDIGNLPFLGPLQSACAGAILGESFISEDRPAELVNTPVRSYANAFLFLATRAISYGLSDLMDGLFTKWLSTHRLLKQPVKSSTRDLLLIGQILASLNSKHRRFSDSEVDAAVATNLAEALFELQKEQWISRGTIGRLLRYGGDVLNVVDQMKDTREQRVIGFDRLLASGAIRNEHPTIAAFIYGYVASLISPGTLSHAGLLTPILVELPYALPWYGLCAGLYKNNEVLSFGKGLCRRLVRDVTAAEPLLGNPRADIAFEELDMLLSGPKALEDFRRASQSFVVVELFPMISGSFKWRTSAEQSQMGLFDSPPRREAMRELEVAAHRLLEILRELGMGQTTKPRSWKKKKAG